MKEKLVICDSTYKCTIEKCMHKIPHKPFEHGCDQLSGGTKLICEASRMKSICVPIEEGGYRTTEVEQCKHCGGTGTIKTVTWRKIPD